MSNPLQRTTVLALALLAGCTEPPPQIDRRVELADGERVDWCFDLTRDERRHLRREANRIVMGPGISTVSNTELERQTKIWGQPMCFDELY